MLVKTTKCSRANFHTYALHGAFSMEHLARSLEPSLGPERKHRAGRRLTFLYEISFVLLSFQRGDTHALTHTYTNTRTHGNELHHILFTAQANKHLHSRVCKVGVIGSLDIFSHNWLRTVEKHKAQFCGTGIATCAIEPSSILWPCLSAHRLA